MRFTVIGTDAETGQSVEMTVEARDADMAERFAAKRQINVQKVSIAKMDGPAVADPAPSAMEPLAPLEPMPAKTVAAPAAAPAPVRPSAVPPATPPSPQSPAALQAPVASAPAVVAAPPPRPAPAMTPPAPSVRPPATPAPASMPVTAPVVRPQQPAGNARPGRGLAIAAVVLGLIALLFCWIPVISLLSMPLSGVGLLLAIIAGVLVITKKRGSILMPVTGVAVCGLCLFVTLMVTSSLITQVAAAADQMKSEMDRQSAQAYRDEKAANVKPARNLSVVASDPKHSATIPALSVVPQQNASSQLPDDKTDLGKPVVVGDAEVSITRVAMEPVTLVGDDGYLQGESESRFLTLKLEIKNLGKEKMVYRTLAVDSMSSVGPTLRDDLGRLYPSVTFGLTARPSGRAEQETLEPGAVATDVLVFQPAAVGGKPKWLELDIPGKLLGGQHTVTARVSAEAIR